MTPADAAPPPAEPPLRPPHAPHVRQLPQTLQVPQVLRPQWPMPARVCAAVTRRGGGVSRAPFESLNLATHVGDDPAAVAENRRRVRAALALPSEPLWLSQVHGAGVVDADAPGYAAERRPTAAPTAGATTAPMGTEPPAGPSGDAAITRSAGRVLAVLVADCLPVLFAHRDGGAVGVAHAGWRGLAAGVLEATVQAFNCPAAQLGAWLGPAIGPAHFEVGEEVRSAFCAHDPTAAVAFRSNDRGRWQCDLSRLARQRLQRLGVHAVEADPVCNYSDAQGFYSYRRDGRTGRFAALIWLEPGG